MCQYITHYTHAHTQILEGEENIEEIYHPANKPQEMQWCQNMGIWGKKLKETAKLNKPQETWKSLKYLIGNSE